MTRLLSSLRAQASAVDESPWLQDEFVEFYGRWREESGAVRISYDRWTDAERDDEPFAYARRRGARPRAARRGSVP